MATVMPLLEADLPPTSFFDRTGADLSGLAAPAGVHPAATLLPAMRAEDLELLRRSLEAGWREGCPPILVDRAHRVIDGRHRVEILGAPIEQLIAEGRARVVEWDDDAIVHHVLAANLARRQLTMEERRELYRRLTSIFGTRRRGGAAGRPAASNGSDEPLPPPPSRAERARLAGISVATAKRLDAAARRPAAGGGRGGKPAPNPAPVAAAKVAPAGRPGAGVQAAAAAVVVAGEESAPAPAAPARAERQEGRERRAAALEALWAAFVALDPEDQLVFVGRALDRLGDGFDHPAGGATADPEAAASGQAAPAGPPAPRANGPIPLADETGAGRAEGVPPVATAAPPVAGTAAEAGVERTIGAPAAPPPGAAARPAGGRATVAGRAATVEVEDGLARRVARKPDGTLRLYGERLPLSQLVRRDAAVLGEPPLADGRRGVLLGLGEGATYLAAREQWRAAVAGHGAAADLAAAA